MRKGVKHCRLWRFNVCFIIINNASQVSIRRKRQFVLLEYTVYNMKPNALLRNDAVCDKLTEGSNICMEAVGREQKSTLFKDIFKESKYFLDLYECCTGVRLNEEDITRFDLDSDVVSRERYNDVSFITNDNRSIYMIEHQSTISSNLPVKIGAYFFDVLRLWAEHENYNVHAGKQIPFPKPEFYVVYNGKQRYRRKHEIFDCGSFMQIKVPVIDIHYDNLVDKNPNNYLAGYSYLQYEYDRSTNMGMPELEALERAVQICKQEGYLKDIIGQEGFATVNYDLFSYDNQLRWEGREEGRKEGKKEGKKEGRIEGKKEGKAETSRSVAKKMLEAGIPVETITSCTDLTLKVVTKIRKTPNKEN